MEFTGERFIPGTRGEIWVEHWHRYHFAARWAGGSKCSTWPAARATARPSSRATPRT
jgi:hypothetical protein